VMHRENRVKRRESSSSEWRGSISSKESRNNSPERRLPHQGKTCLHTIHRIEGSKLQKASNSEGVLEHGIVRDRKHGGRKFANHNFKEEPDYNDS